MARSAERVLGGTIQAATPPLILAQTPEAKEKAKAKGKTQWNRTLIQVEATSVIPVSRTAIAMTATPKLGFV